MQDLHGEYSLPYIDKGYENPGIKKIVDFLIEEEKNKSEPLNIDDEPIEQNATFSIKSYETKSPLSAKYESLSREKLLLQDLLSRRKELWGDEIKELASYISKVEDEQSSLQDEINGINLQRVNAQKEAELRMLRLKKQIKDMESYIESEKREIERLNLE